MANGAVRSKDQAGGGRKIGRVNSPGNSGPKRPLLAAEFDIRPLRNPSLAFALFLGRLGRLERRVELVDGIAKRLDLSLQVFDLL
jgi:hypothetical protein